MAQRVLITAGASGIGREIARAFAANGARVFVCDIDADALASFARRCPNAITTRCDVADRRDVENMVAAGAAALGGLDVLVNNAGIAGPTEPVEAMDPDEWEKVVAVNLNGTFNVTRCAIPHLKRSAAGVIINMSSVAGRLGYPNRSPYATTKWGIDRLHQDAVDGAWRIRHPRKRDPARRGRRARGSIACTRRAPRSAASRSKRSRPGRWPTSR